MSLLKSTNELLKQNSKAGKALGPDSPMLDPDQVTIHGRTVAEEERAPASLRLKEIVLDPKLQCRAAMNPATVAEYVEVLKEGDATFPPVSVIRVEGELLLVDGWHRHEAYRVAGRTVIPTTVRDGSRRDAVLAAIQANRSHGLQRTQADKERAVVALLMDREWAGMSNRDLAQLAGVSHVHVGNVRARFGVEKGAVLTPEWRAIVTGEPTPQWAALLETARKEYYGREAESIRVAATPEVLAPLMPHPQAPKSVRACFALRAGELAAQPWPWPEDQSVSQRGKRAAGLDTVPDLVRAVSSTDCAPELCWVLYGVLQTALELPTSAYVDYKLVESLDDRPRLWAQAKARREELRLAREKAEAAEKARGPKDPYDWWKLAREAASPEEQEKILATAPEKTWAYYVTPNQLRPGVRDGLYRERVGSAGACQIPGCDGWIIGKDGGATGTCAVCGRSFRTWEREIQQASAVLTRALELPGVAVGVGGVVLDANDLAASLAISNAWRADRAGVEKWLKRAPGELAEAMLRWVSSPPPTVRVESGGTADARAGEEHEEENLDADDEGDDGLDEVADGAA
jgi:hypothetical protein